MAKSNMYRDPRGHSLRIYQDIYNSHAYKALSSLDVMAYLALMEVLKGYNNGDLSLTLSRAKTHKIKHHVTLARCLRALCAVGLIALTRKGGCTKGGQRQPNLYRLTDRECYENTSKHLDAIPATNDWKRVSSIKHGLDLISASEAKVKSKTAKLKIAGQEMTKTMSEDVLVDEETTTSPDTCEFGLRHFMTVDDVGERPVITGLSADYYQVQESTIHRTPCILPLYIATPLEGKVIASVPPSVTRKAVKLMSTMPRGLNDDVVIRAGRGAGLTVEQLIDWADQETVFRSLAAGPLPFKDLWTVIDE